MAIECEKCQHDNPGDSRFCGHCGEKLPLEAAMPRTINESDVNQQTQKFIAQFADNIKLEAAKIKMAALEDFQDRAMRWVKIQFVTATAALSIVLAFLAWLGYSGWDVSKQFQADLTKGKQEIISIKDEYQLDVDKNLQAMEDEKNKYLEEYRRNLEIVSDSRLQLQQIRKDVTDEAAVSLNLITEKRKELEDFDLTQLERYRGQLTSEINRNVQLQMNIESQVSTLNEQVSRLDKIERSRYQILLHYGGSDLGHAEPTNFSDMQRKLYEKGYIVDLDDIMNVTADRQEIVYYSATADMGRKVDEIIELILPQVDGNIGKKLERSGNNDPFQIVIKLCPLGTIGGLRCK